MATKNEETNKKARELFQKAMHEAFIEGYWNCNKTQLRSCTAWVYETDSFYILKSYETYIACIEKASGVVADVLRDVYGYTATSAQHITKFSRDYGCQTFYRWQ